LPSSSSPPRRYKQAAQILAAKGKRLVVSLKNGFNGAAPVNAKVGHPCVVPMDEFVKAMAGKSGSNKFKLPLSEACLGII
jgi:hypothetical protein